MTKITHTSEAPLNIELISLRCCVLSNLKPLPWELSLLLLFFLIFKLIVYSFGTISRCNVKLDVISALYWSLTVDSHWIIHEIKQKYVNWFSYSLWRRFENLAEISNLEIAQSKINNENYYSYQKIYLNFFLRILIKKTSWTRLYRLFLSLGGIF